MMYQLYLQKKMFQPIPAEPVDYVQVSTCAAYAVGIRNLKRRISHCTGSQHILPANH